jgi:hypothetical protein
LGQTAERDFAAKREGLSCKSSRFLLVTVGTGVYKERDVVMKKLGVGTFGQGNNPKRILESCAHDRDGDLVVRWLGKDCIMRVAVTIIMCIDAAALVWTGMLPGDNPISRAMMTTPVDEETTDESVARLTLQVDGGRQYMQLYDDNKAAISIMPFVLVLNMGFALLIAIRLQLSRNTVSTKSTEQDAPADAKRPRR